MSKYVSNVRFQVSSDKRDSFVQAVTSFNIADFEGALSHQVVDCGDGRFATTVEWESRDALVVARPGLIAFLDTVRPLLTEISPELGVTDPISGAVIFEA